MQIINTAGFLNILSSGVLKGYSLTSVEKIDWYKDPLGNFFIRLTYVGDRGCVNEPLVIPLASVTNQPTWTNTIAGANTAVQDISNWIGMDTATIVVSGTTKTPTLLRVSGSAGTIVAQIQSISFANTGTANATISVDSGATFSVLKPKEVVSIDAGDINNNFPIGSFQYNATTVGAELLIIYIV